PRPRPRGRSLRLRRRATDMRTITSLVLVALTAACAVGPGYHRPSLGMPDGWRPSSASEDSLRPFYDSLRTSRDTLLPHGADTARLPFTYDVLRATADLSWELDVWGRLRRSTQAARADLAVRQEDRRALELSLIGDVATGYVDLREADRDLEIARRTLASRRLTLALAQQRLNQGLISELDVRQFEAEVASPAA